MTLPIIQSAPPIGIAGTVGTTDNALVRADGTGGYTAQGSVATLGDTGALSISGAGTAVTLQYDNNGAYGSSLTFFMNSASPANSDTLWYMDWNGKNSAAGTVTYCRLFTDITDTTSTSEDGRYVFQTKVAGTMAGRMRIAGGVFHESATGTDKGDNTINFGAVYDDNTLLTCAPVEMLQTGKIDLAKWDALVPPVDVKEEKNKDGVVITPAEYRPREHKVVREFKAMVDSGFDPRDPRNFVNRMKADGAVPGLMTQAEWSARIAANDKPDMGYMTTRMMLAIDNLAVMCASLLERIEALEGKRAK